ERRRSRTARDLRASTHGGAEPGIAREADGGEGGERFPGELVEGLLRFFLRQGEEDVEERLEIAARTRAEHVQDFGQGLLVGGGCGGGECDVVSRQAQGDIVFTVGKR